MARYYRHICRHTSLYHPWQQGEEVPHPDPCGTCRTARIGELIQFARHGEPPASGSSRNHREGTGEEGVSVYEVVAGQMQYTGWWYGIAERSLYYGTGVIVGWGSDGEPLVRI